MDLGLVNMPVYTSLAAAALMLLHVVLMVLVIVQRGKTEVMIGTGTGTGSGEVLERSIRVHANLTENAPVFLIGLGLLELITGSNVWVLTLGGVFVIARVLHAIGLSMNSGVSVGRFIGTVGTLITLLVTASYLAYCAMGHL